MIGLCTDALTLQIEAVVVEKVGVMEVLCVFSIALLRAACLVWSWSLKQMVSHQIRSVLIGLTFLNLFFMITCESGHDERDEFSI